MSERPKDRLIPAEGAANFAIEAASATVNAVLAICGSEYTIGWLRDKASRLEDEVEQAVEARRERDR